MSERQQKQTIETEIQNPYLMPQVELGQVDAARMSGDIGAINTEVLERGFTHARIAYNGLRARIADRRAERALETAETMDRREDLYGHLRDVALGTAKHGPTTPKPRDMSERFADSRLEAAIDKKRNTESHRKWVTGTYQSDKSSSMGRRSRRAQGELIKEQKARYRAGEITAAELRLEKNKILATPIKFENTPQRRSRKKVERATNNVEKLANRYARTSRHSARRRERALNRLDRQTDRAQEFRDQQEELRDLL